MSARRRSYNPGRGRETAPVWAPARSLATTCAIIVIFSSSGYLDVSVPRVRPPPLTAVWRDRSRRVSPFGHPRVAGYLPLTAAFRSLSRPSSPPRATGIPHAPFFSFLSLFKRHAVRMCPRQRGRRRGRAFSTLVVVARFLFQLDFSLRFRDTRPLTRPPKGAWRSVSLFTLRVPNMSMTSFLPVEDNGLEPLTPCLQSRCSTS